MTSTCHFILNELVFENPSEHAPGAVQSCWPLPRPRPTFGGLLEDLPKAPGSWPNRDIIPIADINNLCPIMSSNSILRVQRSDFDWILVNALMTSKKLIWCGLVGPV